MLTTLLTVRTVGTQLLGDLHEIRATHNAHRHLLTQVLHEGQHLGVRRLCPTPDQPHHSVPHLPSCLRYYPNPCDINPGPLWQPKPHGVPEAYAAATALTELLRRWLASSRHRRGKSHPVCPGPSSQHAYVPRTWHFFVHVGAVRAVAWSRAGVHNPSCASYPIDDAVVGSGGARTPHAPYEVR